MSYIEFQELLDLVSAFDSDFPRSRAGFAFRMGMMTQSEESYSSRFQDARARVALVGAAPRVELVEAPCVEAGTFSRRPCTSSAVIRILAYWGQRSRPSPPSPCFFSSSPCRYVSPQHGVQCHQRSKDVRRRPA